MEVNLDACIHCNLCVRACREVQVNDVIGMLIEDPKQKLFLILMILWEIALVLHVENVFRHALLEH